jgi:hypothetical protein
MTETDRTHRLEGLEPDNLLAFLALLGLLRALETARPRWYPRAAWHLNHPPLRPLLILAEPQTRESVGNAVAEGVRKLAQPYDFGGLAKLKLSRSAARSRLADAVKRAEGGDPLPAQMWSALISDAAVRAKSDAVERTLFCLLDVTQTSFLKNLAEVCSQDVLPRRGDRARYFVAAFGKALFATWRRQDQTPSFRWDPVEDSRHAHRWSAPTYEKQGVEHGANMLAAVALPVLTVVPIQQSGGVRLQVLGGISTGGPAFAWPIWREPASLSGIRCLLSHPDLRTPGALTHLGVDHIRVSRRINPPGSKYANFTRAEAILSADRASSRRIGTPP